MDAIVLSGEGAKAAFQAGTIKWLETTQGVNPQFICGASSGALTSAVYSHVGSDGLIALWQSVNGMSDIFNFQWNFVTQMGIYGHKPVMDKLTNIVMNNIRKIPAMCNRVNLFSNEFQRIYSDQVSKEDYIAGTISSISIPTLVEPFDGQWVDGGARELAPIGAAIDRGATNIYVCLATPPKYLPIKPFTGLANILGVPILRLAEIGSYSVDMILQQNLLNDIRLAVLRNNDPNYKKVNIRVFGPTAVLGSPLDFSIAKPWVDLGLTETVEYDPSSI